jgi:hypothetical protein
MWALKCEYIWYLHAWVFVFVCVCVCVCACVWNQKRLYDVRLDCTQVFDWQQQDWLSLDQHAADWSYNDIHFSHTGITYYLIQWSRTKYTDILKYEAMSDMQLWYQITNWTTLMHWLHITKTITLHSVFFNVNDGMTSSGVIVNCS